MSKGQIILHHYPQSPVTEKVRVVLGMKSLSWKSVEIPRLPPKPNLMPLTGGYRLTPVMQIGADIYCDTKCIIRELERRHPDPTLFPGGAYGMAWGVGQWTDGPLFTDVITVALVEMAPNMPPEFLADRGPLYFGPDFSLEDIKSKYTDALVNIRAQFGWFDERLKQRDFMLGAEPGLPDALAYYLVWFLRDRMADGDRFLSQFESLIGWEQRVKAIGHGTPEEFSDLDALAIAKAAEPETPEQRDPGDPSGLDVGMAVTIAPASGGPRVVGTVRSLSPDQIAILRTDTQVGQVCVHFPRMGYRVTPA
ncbi:MAG: glutathione S-transferase family protein [Rhodospirillaceae bacterium]|jgi:glutathione S-transferase|nr:glutathione S-transferase family protein [Rhodospirillaceae bacterium]MBT6138307.1 glutathione S-transferase family protein [Rhodospirillaceae bacterium]